MSETNYYATRERINPKAFALRHLIIEEIKFRKLSNQIQIDAEKRWDRIARGIMVSFLPRRKLYEIYFEGRLFTYISKDQVTFYLRGDTERGQQTQAKLAARLPELSDGILEKNRQFVVSLVNVMEHTLRLQEKEKVAHSGPNSNQAAQATASSFERLTQFVGLSCVLPAFNERGNVGQAITTLATTLESELKTRSIIGDYEIIVVDDGSSDGTAREVQEVARHFPKIRLIRHAVNQGYGAALYSGLTVAQYDLVFFTDSDNQFDYTQVQDFLSQIGDCDLVAGYRQNRQDPLIRKVNAQGWNLLVRMLFGHLSQDIDCAFKLFRKSALDQINLLHIRGRGAIINTEILVRMKQRQLMIREIPVRHYPRELGEQSGANPLVIGRAFYELGKLMLRLSVEKFGWLGFVTGLFSRTNRPMEVIKYRRSKMLLDTDAVLCRLCGADADSVRQTNLKTCEDLTDMGDYSVFYCIACRNAFTYPLPDESKRVLTPDVSYHTFSFPQRLLMNWFIELRVRRVTKAIGSSQTGRILDIGGGNCAFANALAERGFEVTVVEPNSANSTYANSDVRFIGAWFSEELIKSKVLSEGEFDLVTMWHSLEHLPEPLLALELCKRLLRPGGCLYLCVPNLNSLQADLSGNRWVYLDVPHHLTHFTLDGLITQLRSLGYGQFNIHWFSPEYEIFGFYQTLLNMISLSHNYYYNRAKKGKIIEENLRFPTWTKAVTRMGFILLPLAFGLSVWADAAGKPASIEVHCYKNNDTEPLQGMIE